MIVYVETNFVIELALEQEEVLAAEAILKLAESGKITLAFPSFILAESMENILRKRAERNSLHSSLVRVLKELQRSEPHKRIMVDLEAVTTVLRDSHIRELDLLYATFNRLFNIAECLDLNTFAFRSALAYQKTFALLPKDSMIYSAIIANLQTRPIGEKKCFISRDKKAFDTDEDHGLKAELEAYTCKYIGSFPNGLDFIQYGLQDRI
jgi:predicted nucleic acid-binding protein